MAIVSHKRKIISALLASVVSLTTVGVSAIPAQAAGEQLTYDTDANNNVTITGCVGTCPEILVIPATLGGNPVTNIGDAAFVHTAITSVTIPNSVTTVGNYAFASAKLTSLSIPASVTTLGDGAFKSNELTSITVPSTVRNIGAAVFQSNQLTSATFLGDAPTTEFGYVFDGNPDLPYIVVPIGASGWNAIYSNTKVVPTVPNAPTGVVGKIGDNQAFVSWVAPTDDGGTPITGYRVTSNPGSQTCSTAVGISRNELRCVVTGLTNGTSYRFTVVAINLRGESIASLSSAPVTPEPDKFTYTTDAFDNVMVTGCVGTCPSTLVIPATLGDNPVTKIGEYAFFDTRVTSVTIPNSVTTIEEWSFWGTGLTSLTIPTSVTSIGAFAFGNNQLTSLSIPASLTSIGSGAFKLNSLTTLTIPSTVTNFGAGAFQFNSLTSVTFLGDAPNDPNYMFDPTPPIPALLYIVVPVGALGWGEFYSGIPVYNINTIPTVPDAPTGVVGVSGPEQVTVSWVAPANTGGASIRSYTVRSIPAGGTCSTDELSCTITGLTKGSTYTFAVAATNLIGISAKSSPSSTVTVNGRNQAISITQVSDRTWSNQVVTVSVSSNDVDTELGTELEVTLASTTLTICTVNGSDVTTLRPGTCTLRATQAGNDDYEAATPVTMSFQVLKASQVPLQVAVNSVTRNGATITPVTLTLANAISPSAANVFQVLGMNSAATVSANLQSLQPISSSTSPTFSVLPSDASSCTVSSEGIVAITKVGNCRVQVQAPADDFYLASGQQLASDPVGVLTVWISTVAYVSPEVNFGDGSGVNYTKGGKITPTFMSKFVGSFTYVISFTDKSKSFSVMGCPLNQYKDKAKKICKAPKLVQSATCTLTSVKKMTGKEFTKLQPFKFGSCQINAAGLAKLRDENIAKRPKIAMRADFRPVWPVNGKVRAKSQKDGKYYTAIPRKGTRVFIFG